MITTMTPKEIEDFLNEPEVTRTEEVVYSSTGKPYTVICTVKRRCSENPATFSYYSLVELYLMI